MFKFRVLCLILMVLLIATPTLFAQEDFTANGITLTVLKGWTAEASDIGMTLTSSDTTTVVVLVGDQIDAYYTDVSSDLALEELATTLQTLKAATGYSFQQPQPNVLPDIESVLLRYKVAGVGNGAILVYSLPDESPVVLEALRTDGSPIRVFEPLYAIALSVRQAGEEPAPIVATPSPTSTPSADLSDEVFSVSCFTTAYDFELEIGQSIEAICPANCIDGAIWGTDIYTSDSGICTAAIHAGVISAETGGGIEITLIEGQDSYEGSTRNDIISEEWEAWDSSFTLAASEVTNNFCTTTADDLRLELGQSTTVICEPGCVGGAIWGTDIYTSDSSICSAAVHAGIISTEEGGGVQITMIDGQASYEGSTRNGITSEAWSAWESSFIIEIPQ